GTRGRPRGVRSSAHLLWCDAGQRGHEPSQPFRLGGGGAAEPDVMGKFDLEAMVRCRLLRTGRGIELERAEQGAVGPSGGRRGGESSSPGVEGGRGDPLTGAEGGNGQAAGGLPPKAKPPGVFETEVLGTCHELTPGLEERNQPSTVAAVARLVLPCAYAPPEFDDY